MIRGEAPSNQPSEQVFPSIPASVGICRVIPTPDSGSPHVAVVVAVTDQGEAGTGRLGVNVPCD